MLDELARVLPAGFPVYVAHTPKASPDDMVRVALRIQALGLTASPHIIARRVVDPQRLRERLRALVAGGVEQVLLVAGDRGDAERTPSQARSICSTAVWSATSGSGASGVAGHPEGHPAVAG